LSHIRHRVNRQVTEFFRHQRSYDLEDRVANIEQNLRLPQCDQASPKLKQSKKNKKLDKLKACAASIDDKETWKEALLRKVCELEAAQRPSDVQSKKISAENDALHKEVGRLRHLEQLRSVPEVSDRRDGAVSNSNQSVLPQRRCFNCDDPGHFARNCPLSRRRTSGELQRGNDLQSQQVNRASDINWLVANEAVWNFKSSIIWLNGHSFLVHPRPDKHRWCRRVHDSVPESACLALTRILMDQSGREG